MNLKSVLLASVIAILNTPAFAQSPTLGRDAIIQQALDQGAHIVRCVDHQCHDDQTGEDMGYAQTDGAYLVYPDDAAGQLAQNQMAKSLKQGIAPNY